MRTQGSLAEQDFPRLVQALHERRWTGVLSLTHAGAGKSVVVQNGRMVFASSSSKDERLGELMLRRGRITLRQLANAGKAMVPGKRLGTLLVEQGALAVDTRLDGRSSRRVRSRLHRPPTAAVDGGERDSK